jgi:hypothetical protein
MYEGLSETFKFYEYTLVTPGLRSIRWYPYSKSHIFILYKNSLETVNYGENLFQPELEIDLVKLYASKY